MPAHQRVRAWVAHNYKKPAIDQEWLADCSDWVASEFGLDAVADFDQFIQRVEEQLLCSNLADSTVVGSGIDPLLVASNPDNAPVRPRPSGVRRAPRQIKTTGGTPLLVEIKSITEIAHSAFSLLNTHQTRLDRADLGLAQEGDAEQHRDEDEGPVPSFPRGMLRFELSDGSTTFSAIEFRSLPQLELGTTPLGFKMLLHSTPIRNGIAFLEPSNVTLKGHSTQDHDVNREQVFLSSLRKRLGRPDPPPDAPVAAQPQINPSELAPTQHRQPPPAPRPPSPPTDINDMYVDDDDVDPDVLHEMIVQMDDVIVAQDNQPPAARAPIPARPPSAPKGRPTASSISKQTIASSSLGAPSTSSVKSSPYFTADSLGFNTIPDIGLSPRHPLLQDPEPSFDIPWDIDDSEPSKLPPREIGSTSAKRLPTVPIKHAPYKREPPSPDPFDNLSFDMDVDDSFLEQVGMIEQGAMSTGKHRAKDIRTEDRPSVVPARKMLSGSVLGTKRSTMRPVSRSSVEPSTRMQSNTKGGPSASSLSGSTESLVPQSTQSSGRRLPRDPSFVIISSSEDEAVGGLGAARPPNLARRHANRGRDQNQDEGADVIDISD